MQEYDPEADACYKLHNAGADACYTVTARQAETGEIVYIS